MLGPDSCGEDGNIPQIRQGGWWFGVPQGFILGPGFIERVSGTVVYNGLFFKYLLECSLLGQTFTGGSLSKITLFCTSKCVYHSKEFRTKTVKNLKFVWALQTYYEYCLFFNLKQATSARLKLCKSQ